MSAQGIKDIAIKYASLLDEKKQQTSYKMQDISSYIAKWFFVQAQTLCAMVQYKALLK